MDKDKIIDGLRVTMEQIVFDPSTGKEYSTDILNDLDRKIYDACKGALEILERLVTDSDTISRQAAIDICRAPHMRNADCSDFEMAIMMLPSAQPEIIRCKDCKYARLTYDGSCKYCDIWFPDEAEYMDGDYYCASAERREVTE